MYKKNMTYHFQVKGIVVGSSGTGKSSVLRRFSRDHFLCYDQKTVGVDIIFRTLVVRDYVVKIQGIDSAGDERFNSITYSYLRDLAFVVVMYDVTSLDTLHQAQVWIKKIRELSDNPHIEIVMAGNKQDLGVSTKNGVDMANNLNVNHMFVSAKTGFRVERLFSNTIVNVLSAKCPLDDNMHGVRTGPLHPTFERRKKNLLCIEEGGGCRGRKRQCCIVQ
jgi:Ras-related protein Rab-1A